MDWKRFTKFTFLILLFVFSFSELVWAEPDLSRKPKLFSPDSFWNKKLSDNESIDPSSKELVEDLVKQSQVQISGMKNPWMNTKQYCTPLFIADSSTPKFPVTIYTLSGKPRTWTTLYQEAQRGIPIPSNALSAAGMDGHITIYDKDADVLYEFWQFWKVDGKWQASWGGILRDASKSNGIMPTVKSVNGRNLEYWGATATGLPTIGGTVLIEELKTGKIPHALAIAIGTPQDTYVWPAQRGDGTPSGIIPEGTRFRLKPDVKIDPNWPPLTKMIAEAARDYGIVIRDKTLCVLVFSGEDYTQYGVNPYPHYLGGLNTDDAMENAIKLFPFDQLVALKNSGLPKKSGRMTPMDGDMTPYTPSIEFLQERDSLLAYYRTINNQTAKDLQAKVLVGLISYRLDYIENELIRRKKLNANQKTEIVSEEIEEGQKIEALKQLQKRFKKTKFSSRQENYLAPWVDRKLYKYKLKANGIPRAAPDLPSEV